MANQPSDSSELFWRRKLSDSEGDGLHLPPELELEAHLTAALDKIPDAPVPSNFSARVLAAIDLEVERETRMSGRTWNWRLLLPRVAVVAALLVFAGVSLQRYEANLNRLKLAKNLAVAVRTQLPSIEALENLDAIQRMSQPVRADGELLAALQ